MFNLLRMDLYRAKRSKSVYICLGILFFTSLVMFGLLWLMVTPRGQEIALHIKMLYIEEVEGAESILNNTDVLDLFRQTCMDGGGYSVLFGIWVMLFTCTDFQSGFVKNVMAFHQNRWNYVGSKLLTAGIVDFCYLALHFLFTLLLNRVCGNLVPGADLSKTVFYLTWAWLVTMAFAALIIMVCILTRSVAAGSLAAVLLGGGVAVSLLYGILNTFHVGSWLKYSIYMTLSRGPGEYAAWQDMYVYAVGAGFLIFYTAVTGIVLKRQDI